MISNQNKLIKTKQQKIYLETLSLEHISSNYLDWVNDPVLTKYLNIGKRKLTKNDLINYVNHSPNNGRINYAIMTSETKNHIGNCSIYDINEKDKSYEIGWLIGDEHFSGGLYAPMAMFEVHKIALLDMNLEKCRGKVEKENIKARLNNKFIGYKEISNENFYNKYQNKYFDIINVELHKNDWLLRADILSKKHPGLFQINEKLPLN